MTIVTSALGIRAVQLRAQIGAVKLEKKGMRRRGRSVSAMLKDFYGLPKRASYDALLASLQDDLANVEEQYLRTAVSEEANS
jgi:hypothetical protein